MQVVAWTSSCLTILACMSVLQLVSTGRTALSSRSMKGHGKSVTPIVSGSCIGSGLVMPMFHKRHAVTMPAQDIALLELSAAVLGLLWLYKEC